MNGKLILVDGLSGSGKGTVISSISDFFKEHEYDTITVKEPSSFLDKIISEVRKQPERDPELEMLLYTADRKHLFNETIKPHLEKPKSAAISDRSFIATKIYQGLQGVDPDKIDELNAFYPQPDIAFIFLCDPKEAVKRINKRQEEQGIEVTLDENVKRITELRKGYEKFVDEHSYAVKIITDGSKSAVKYQVTNHLNNLLGIEMNKAIFLDKDGTLVDNSGYPEKIPSDDIYIDATVEGLKKFQSEGYKLLMISSQPWVAQGRLSLEETDNIFKSVVSKYAEHGVKINGFYYCPHHRSEGCTCKKPQTALFEQAVDEHNIDISKSYMIGDMENDMIAGRNFGLKTCFVKSPANDSRNIECDYNVDDINAFVSMIYSSEITAP